MGNWRYEDIPSRGEIQKTMNKYMENVETIDALAKIKNAKLRKQYIQHLSKNELMGIKQLINAVLKGRMTGTRGAMNKLRRFKKPLRAISQGSMTKAKTVLKQHGGILPILAPMAAKMVLPLVTSALGPLIGKLFK
jgi:NADP-dependent 3-hydroxy acid dehydrogenase YdfG